MQRVAVEGGAELSDPVRGRESAQSSLGSCKDLSEVLAPLQDESGRLYIEAEVTGNLAEPGSHARGPGEKIVRRLRGARAVHRELSALQERYWWQDLEVRR